VATYEEYKALGYDKLHRELKKIIAQSQRVIVWFNEGERASLLPALQAMKDLVAQPGRRDPDPNKPNWADECMKLGITPEQIRQWKTRTGAESDISYLLGKQPKAASVSASGADKIALKYLVRLTKAVINGDEVEAERVASAVAELYKL